jgi:ABC-type nitrate/sulfonate/bicarbonate transport system substrate-binding protein
MRDGAVDIVAGSAHSTLSAFPRWQGAKLLCAQSQGMYWFLVMRSDIGAKRGDVTCVKGRRIGAAPWVGMGLGRLLVEAGIELERDDVTIAPTPGSLGERINFGVMAAQALEDRIVDGFWANGMGAEIAVKRGIGTLVLDVRRGDGPKAAFNYTMATLATTERLIAAEPEKAAAAVKAVVAAQKALVADVARAADVGRALFPSEAEMIVDLVRKDLPYYDAQLSPEFVAGMNRFASEIGILDAEVPYESVVATEFSPLWQ